MDNNILLGKIQETDRNTTFFNISKQPENNNTFWYPFGGLTLHQNCVLCFLWPTQTSAKTSCSLPAGMCIMWQAYCTWPTLPFAPPDSVLFTATNAECHSGFDNLTLARYFLPYDAWRSFLEIHMTLVPMSNGTMERYSVTGTTNVGNI